MAEYSHVNLSELEDQAPNLGADPKDFNIFSGVCRSAAKTAASASSAMRRE